MNTEFVLSSRVRIARNYEDMPFQTAGKPELAERCVRRTMEALDGSPLQGTYTLIRLADLTDLQRRVLMEQRAVSADLLKHPDTAALLSFPREELSVMINEDDHLRIQAMVPGLDLLTPAARVFRVDDVLSRQEHFAFDSQLGYLTACPTNTGTGMRASLLMHLPLLTQKKQMGRVSQIVAKVGLVIRGVYGEGAEALGHVYQVSNQVTLGRTEQELISALTAVGHQLIKLEDDLRKQALREDRLHLEDSVYRAAGILGNARLLTGAELYKYWSDLRLGVSLDLLKGDPGAVDNLLDETQDAHLCAWAQLPLEGDKLSAARASRVRQLMKPMAI